MQNTTIKDELVMSKVAQGDIGQLSLLFERHHLRLYNFFYKMNYNQTLSEDLTQNVFERMIRYKHTYNESIPFLPWIYRIARNVQADHYRNNKIKLAENSLDSSFDVADDTENTLPDDNIGILKQAMARISNEYREILLLTRYEGMKYAEVAETLQCSEVNVKVRVHRAIKALRREFFKINQTN